MPTEVWVQRDMFTGESVDTRSTVQRSRNKTRSLPTQTEMFSQRALAQFGVQANPRLPLSPNTRLELAIQDPRTEEEKEHDRLKAAEAATYALFGPQPESPDQPPERTRLFPSGLRLALREVEGEEPNLAVRVAEGVELLYWSSRDAALEEAGGFARQHGYRPHTVGADALELWKMDGSGYFRVTYSAMDMIEDIAWTPQKGGL